MPIYDGHSVDFNIKNFHHLPVYAIELEFGAVVMVMFTIGQYSGNKGVMLSFNVQAAVTLHDRVDESEYPPDTILGAKDPFPII